MAALVLPVCHKPVRVRPLTGADELALLEAVGDTAAALALAGRVAEGGPADWLAATPTDLDAVLLMVRQAALGDAIRSDATCPAPECGKRADVAFGVVEYLQHHLPELLVEAVPTEGEESWFRLPGSTARFRPATVADQLAVRGEPDPAAAMAARCVQSPGGEPVTTEWMRRAEAELDRIAPNLAGEVSGRCPECGRTVAVFFDPRRFCLTELRARARFLFRDVDRIARRYHWSETDILALPAARRATYAEWAKQPDGGQ